MGFLFGDKNKQQPKMSRQQIKQIKKQIGIDLAPYAKKDELDGYFNERVTTEQRKALWGSMSPQLKIKVLKFVKEQREAKRGRK